MFGEITKKRVLTRRCKAVTTSGPCKNWTEYEFCHTHEWKVNELVMSTRQAFVLVFPKAVARLAQVIDERDSEVALKGIIVCLKYMLGDKPVTEGLLQGENLGDLTVAELVTRAQGHIAVLQQQHPLSEGERSDAAPAAAPAVPGDALETALKTG